MGRVWSDEHRMQLWLQVELAVCEAWTELGVIPEEDMAAIRGATVQADRSAELFRETHHDMISFTRSIAERLGPPGRWIHLGLTSSDVLDTALSLQIQEAADIHAGRALQTHPDDRSDARRPRRADHLRAQARGLCRPGATRLPSPRASA
jgi:adenylosuccinate lyase